MPKFGAGQYGTEISALMAKPADVTHSSLWGGDLQAFVLQAAPRGLFKRTQVVFSAADHVLPGLGEKMPDGVILGARGAYGLMSPKSALNDWWWDLYSKAYNTYPVQAPYRMAQSLLGLKLAVEKAMAANGGKKPNHEQLAAALKGLEWDSPAGRIRMALGDGHQAVQDTAIGKTRYDAAKKMVVLEDIQRFPADCVNPPNNMNTEVDALVAKATIASRTEVEGRAPKADELAVIVYTSGTTGGAKGVMLSHRNLLLNAIAALRGPPTTARDSALLVLPLHHVMPFMADVILRLSVGARSSSRTTCAASATGCRNTSRRSSSACLPCMTSSPQHPYPRREGRAPAD